MSSNGLVRGILRAEVDERLAVGLAVGDNHFAMHSGLSQSSPGLFNADSQGVGLIKTRHDY